MISPLCRGLDVGGLEIPLFFPRHGEAEGEELTPFAANRGLLVGEPVPETVGLGLEEERSTGIR